MARILGLVSAMVEAAKSAGFEGGTDKVKALEALFNTTKAVVGEDIPTEFWEMLEGAYDEGAYQLKLSEDATAAADDWLCRQTLVAERMHDRYLEDQAEQRDCGYWGD